MTSAAVRFVSPPPDADLLRRLLQEQAPDLAELDLVPLPGGRDNAAVRVGPTWWRASRCTPTLPRS